ncbi:MAG: lipopolysaccharide heptosyltransferase II [Planctomycetaceae bacterium]|nr:lipopolysaccharide heptosyltransferase II [Planctomycetaceae bacterium]
MKLLVFLPNWIGDAVMASPALRALRTRFADAEIVACAKPHVADVLTGLDLVDRLIFRTNSPEHAEGAGWKLVRRLRRERFDVAVLLPNSFRSGLLAAAAGAKQRVGFARDGRRWLLTDSLAPAPRGVPTPALTEYLRLVELLGCSADSRQMELATTEEDEWQLARFWSKQDPSLPERGVVTFNPGGAFGAAKHWPAASFAELARQVATSDGRTVLVLCGPAERNMAREIVRLAAHPHVLSLADMPPSIGLTKAAVRQSELLVTTDSGPRHFAAPFGVPVVTIFGPTHIAWSETDYEAATHVQLKVDCGPCQQRVCPLGHHQCMRDLSARQVYAAALPWLRRKQQSAA